jgi:hypothetical protein
MSVLAWILVCLAAILLAWRAHRKEVRASDTAQWDCPDGAALKAFAQKFDRADRRARLLEPWRAPWPWWFLGACLAFAGLCLGAGLWQWHTPDAPVLILGGLVFGLAAAFKAWAQSLTQAPLRGRLRRRWHSKSRA